MSRLNRIKSSFWVSLLVLFIGTSCLTEDVNRDPNNPTDVPVQNILTGVQVELAYTVGGSVARYNGLYTNHYAGVGRQHLVLGRNSLTESDVNNTWFSLYADVLKDIQQVIAKSTVEGNEYPDIHGIALVLEGLTIGYIANLWGTAPYAEALKDTEHLTPKYDSRDDLFAAAHKCLDDGLAKLAEAKGEASFAYPDLYYGRDLKKWIKAAHTIKARYYLHRGDLAKAATHLNSGIKVPADDLQLYFGTPANEQHPLFQFMEQRAGDLAMGKKVIDVLNAWGDPRRNHLATAGVGVPQGVSASTGIALPGPYIGGGIGGRPSRAAVKLISAVEADYIRAELAVRAKNNDAAHAALFRATAASVVEITGAQPRNDYLATAIPSTVTLKDVILHKYVSLTGQTETYNDLRRTNNILGLPGYASKANPLGAGKHIQRWPFPSSERDFNKESVRATGLPESVIELMQVRLSWDANLK